MQKNYEIMNFIHETSRPNCVYHSQNYSYVKIKTDLQKKKKKNYIYIYTHSLLYIEVVFEHKKNPEH